MLASSSCWPLGRSERAAVEGAELQRYANAGRLLASLAHDVRNLLAGAKANLEYLHEGLRGKDGNREELAEAAREATDGVARAIAVTTDAVNIVKARRPWLSRVDVAEVAREALAALAPRLHRERLELQLGAGIFAVAERERLRQTLVFLLLEAADAGSPRSSIRLSALSQARSVCVTVAVASEADATESARQESHAASDGGIALELCKAVVRSFGGEMSAKVSHQGREFSLVLPAAK